LEVELAALEELEAKSKEDPAYVEVTKFYTFSKLQILFIFSLN